MLTNSIPFHSNFHLETSDNFTSDYQEEKQINENDYIYPLIVEPSSNDSLTIFQKTREPILNLCKVTALTFGISAIDLKLTPLITRFAIDKMGLCVNHIISNQTKSLLSYIVSPLAKFNNKLGQVFGNNLAGTILAPAALEELEFRWLVQDVVLKKIPEQILKTIVPEYAHIVDSDVARISRIALTALLFSASHLHQLNCSEMGGIGPLIGGLIYGYVYEYTDLSLPGCINLHSVYNTLNYLNLI